MRRRSKAQQQSSQPESQPESQDPPVADLDADYKADRAFLKRALLKGPDLIVCDEGHRIKNRDANISTVLKQVQTGRRIVLTGLADTNQNKTI